MSIIKTIEAVQASPKEAFEAGQIKAMFNGFPIEPIAYSGSKNELLLVFDKTINDPLDLKLYTSLDDSGAELIWNFSLKENTAIIEF